MKFHDKRKDASGNHHFHCFPYGCLGNRIFVFSVGDAQRGRDHMQSPNGSSSAGARRDAGNVDARCMERKKKGCHVSFLKRDIRSCHLYVSKFACRFARFHNSPCKWCIHSQHCFPRRVGRSTSLVDTTRITPPLPTSAADHPRLSKKFVRVPVDQTRVT